MRKLLFTFALTLLAAAVRPVVYAADFSLVNLKAGDIAVKAGTAVVPAPAAPVAAAPQVLQDLINKFNQAKDELWQLNSDTNWLSSDIDRLESRANSITQSDTADSFFQNDLQQMAFKMTGYNSDAQRIAGEIKDLINLAQKSAELDQIAHDLDRDACDLVNRAQMEIENSARRLETTVSAAKPELVGYNAQWQAMDISRYSRDFTSVTRDMSWDTRTLLSKTQP